MCFLMFISSFVVSCNLSGGITVTPDTLPGLFISWKLVQESYECDQGNSTNTPTSEIVLTLGHRYEYTLMEDGNLVKEGSFIIEGEVISFSPPVFENALSERITYALSGSQLILRSQELSSPGSNNFCMVKRTYGRD